MKLCVLWYLIKEFYKIPSTTNLEAKILFKIPSLNIKTYLLLTKLKSYLSMNYSGMYTWQRHHQNLLCRFLFCLYWEPEHLVPWPPFRSVTRSSCQNHGFPCRSLRNEDVLVPLDRSVPPTLLVKFLWKVDSGSLLLLLSQDLSSLLHTLLGRNSLALTVIL